MPKVKRRYAGALKLAGTVVTIFGAAILYLRLFAGTVQQRLPSPDGSMVAECRVLGFTAATDSPATTVQLRTKFNPFRHTVFSGLLYGGDVNISWADSGTLVVKCHRCSNADIRGMEQKWNTVSIRYLMTESNKP